LKLLFLAGGVLASFSVFGYAQETLTQVTDPAELVHGSWGG
jgi:hypothetical protein